MEERDELNRLMRRCEELARPLYTGLDGVQSFDRVERVRSRLEALVRADAVTDGVLLGMLALFHGIVDRLGSLAPGGRLDLFLRGCGVEEARRRRLRQGLKRFADEPRTAEERLLHDAVLLEEAGVPAAVGRLLAAGKKKLAATPAVESLDAGPAPERFKTEEGAARGRRERERTEAWLRELREYFSGERA